MEYKKIRRNSEVKIEVLPNLFIKVYSLFRFFLTVLFGKQKRDIILLKLGLYDFNRAFLSKVVYPLCHIFKTNKFVYMFRYEPEVAYFLKGLTGKIFVDVGANLGYFTLLLYKNFETVVSIEPHPEDFETLKRNIQQLTSNVKFVQKAVSDYDGEADFCIEGYSTRGGFNRQQFLISEHESRFKPLKVCKIEAATLTTLLKDYPSIDLIKVDVEGAEWSVLKGAFPIIDKIKRWIIELHNLERKKELENLLFSCGYHYRWLDYNHIFAWRR